MIDTWWLVMLTVCLRNHVLNDCLHYSEKENRTWRWSGRNNCIDLDRWQESKDFCQEQLFNKAIGQFWNCVQNGKIFIMTLKCFKLLDPVRMIVVENGLLKRAWESTDGKLSSYNWCNLNKVSSFVIKYLIENLVDI